MWHDNDDGQARPSRGGSWNVDRPIRCQKLNLLKSKMRCRIDSPSFLWLKYSNPLLQLSQVAAELVGAAASDTSCLHSDSPGKLMTSLASSAVHNGHTPQCTGLISVFFLSIRPRPSTFSSICQDCCDPDDPGPQWLSSSSNRAYCCWEKFAFAKACIGLDSVSVHFSCPEELAGSRDPWCVQLVSQWVRLRNMIGRAACQLRC